MKHLNVELYFFKLSFIISYYLTIVNSAYEHTYFII